MMNVLSVYIVSLTKRWIFGIQIVPSEDLLDRARPQADLRVCLAYISEGTFSHVVALSRFIGDTFQFPQVYFNMTYDPLREKP